MFVPALQALADKAIYKTCLQQRFVAASQHAVVLLSPRVALAVDGNSRRVEPPACYGRLSTPTTRGKMHQQQQKRIAGRVHNVEHVCQATPTGKWYIAGEESSMYYY